MNLQYSSSRDTHQIFDALRQLEKEVQGRLTWAVTLE